MKRTTKVSILLVLTLAASILSLGGCRSYESTTEKVVHKTHFIDFGPAIQDGAKVIDSREILIAPFHDGKAIGSEKRVINGLIVVPPYRWKQATRVERTLIEFIKRHPEIRDELRKIEEEVRK